jgi:16S rRNA (cytosine1402-N4)-methyltransferase
MTEATHIPVMLGEVMHYLSCRPGGTYVDCTVGLGGHSEAVLREIGPEGQLIGLDRDDHALLLARERLTNGRRIKLFHESYENLPSVLDTLHISEVDGILLDLGVSSLQLMSPQRGFSFATEGPLDMRMDTTQKLTAADLVSQLSEKELSDIFREYGEEKKARRIARRICSEREAEPITTTTQLAGIVQRAAFSRGPQRIHPATRVFQALRIAVNDELRKLQTFLRSAFNFLKTGGRMVVISFHSLEDRIVKTEFNVLSGKCVCFRPAEECTCPRARWVRLLTRKPVQPTEEEARRNPRSRSAKLRSVERL